MIDVGIDTATDPRTPTHSKVTEPEEVTKTGLAYLHTAHCLGSGDIMVCIPPVMAAENT